LLCAIAFCRLALAGLMAMGNVIIAPGEIGDCLILRAINPHLAALRG